MRISGAVKFLKGRKLINLIMKLILEKIITYACRACWWNCCFCLAVDVGFIYCLHGGGLETRHYIRIGHGLWWRRRWRRCGDCVAATAYRSRCCLYVVWHRRSLYVNLCLWWSSIKVIKVSNFIFIFELLFFLIYLLCSHWTGWILNDASDVNTRVFRYNVRFIFVNYNKD